MIIIILISMSIDNILPHLSYYYDKNIVNIIKELNADKASYLSYLPKDMINIIINNIGRYFPTEVGFNMIYITKYYIIEMRIEMRIENIISTSIVKLVNSNNNNYEGTVFVPIVSNYLKTHRAYSIKRFLNSLVMYPREQIHYTCKRWYIHKNCIRIRPLFIRSSKDIYDIEHVKINKIE